jgi:subtilisin family serine protease
MPTKDRVGDAAVFGATTATENSMPAPMINHSPERVIAYVSVKSIGGLSLFDGRAVPRAENIRQFTSERQEIYRACRRLEELGFEIERVSTLSVRISGPAEAFERRFGVKFEWEPRASMLRPSSESQARLLDTGFREIEGIVFPEPLELHQPSATSPPLNYFHLRMPDDVASIMNAHPVHADGYRGQNVRAAMIDSGFAWEHPYFQGKGYQLSATQPAGSDVDANGHGTGESANLLAVAPEVRLYGIAMADSVLAFQIARDDLGVKAVSNSWGSAYPTDGPGGFWAPYWKQLEAEIALCAQQGMIVLFSGGNGGMSFTASMPETISVGGVYVDDQNAMQASDYASSFDSTRYPGEHVPQVCGLCGLLPAATYVALPIPPACEIDQARGGPSFPHKDETAVDDGWAVFSGTSAACPMVAGVVALILDKYPNAGMTEILQRLRASGRDVTAGASAMGDHAGPGPDAATGHGLVDAMAACA